MTTMESASSIIESQEQLKFVSLERLESGLVSVVLSQELKDKLGEELMGYASSVAESFKEVLDSAGLLYEVILNEDSSIHIRPLNQDVDISTEVIVMLQNEADSLSNIL